MGSGKAKNEFGTGSALAEAAASELAAILASEQFARSPSLRRFLSFAVECALDGRQSRLKEYGIGVEVFGRGENFDPRLDPIVRVQAGKLRRKLEEYYEGAGAGDPLRIEFPRGTYVPVFRPAGAVPVQGAVIADPPAPAVEPEAGPEPAPPPSEAPKRKLRCSDSAACMMWRRIAVGAITLASLSLLIYWLAQASSGHPDPAHIAIDMSPGDPARVDAETVTVCALLAHGLDDALEDHAGLRKKDGRKAPSRPHKALQRVSPGSTLRGVVRSAGDKVRVEAKLVSPDGRLLWSGVYERDKIDLEALPTQIALDVLTDADL